MKYVLLAVLGVTLTACAFPGSRHQEFEPVVVEVQENKVPGTVTEPWVEPMYDTVRVPGQLDPTGTYYRKGHQTVVEIRPGRLQEVQFPNENDKQNAK